MDQSPKRGLLAAYGRLLGPLVRILIRNGVSFEEFADTAKKSYLEVAERHYKVGEESAGNQRLAVLTGLSLVEVEEIKSHIEASSNKDQDLLDAFVRILTAWHTDSQFTGPYGIPLELKFDESSDDSGFSELSRRHCPEISPKLLLDELRNVGAVIETEKGWFKILTRSYTPKPSAPAGLEYLARTLADIVRTLDHNIQEPDPKKRLFERHVYTEDGIKPEDLPRFVNFANKRAQQLLDEIDNWLTQLEKPKPGAKENLSTGIGIFHYIHDDENEQ